jgi:CheY-like chemotaxis protein
MGQSQQKLIVEDDAELRNLTAALFEDEQLEIIECESAEAALLIGGRKHEPIHLEGRERTVRRKSRWQPTTHTAQRHGSAYRSRSA